MSPARDYTSITSKTFDSVLSKYGDIVAEKLHDLDVLRYETIPQAKGSSKQTPLSKGELEQLVEWKLRHGTWRPQLQKLAASNSEALVKSLTLEASAQLSTKPKPSSQADVRRALDTVAKLKGVGPATASLLLSCFRPDCVPFFSDELYRWLCFGDAPTKGTSGWRRTIGYTFKEYYVLIERARDLVERLKEESEGGDLDMLKLEKVAYVLGKEKADMDASDRDAEDSGDEVTETASEQSDAPPVKPKKVSGTKRSRAAESSTDQKEVASKKARPTRTLSRKK